MTAAACDIPIDRLLRDFGLVGELVTQARSILEREGLTNPRKQNISAAKVSRCLAAIDRSWRRACHNCAPRSKDDGRRLVTVPPDACPSCGGSNNARAVRGMIDCCKSAGIQHVLIVGGSPNTRTALAELVGTELELRLVDGTRSSDKQAARSDIGWADLVVVLGATQLAHKVSLLYTRDADARKKLVNTSRRGIEAIADDVARSDVVRVSAVQSARLDSVT